MIYTTSEIDLDTERMDMPNTMVVDREIRALALLAFFLWEGERGDRFVLACKGFGVDVDDAISALRKGGVPDTADALQYLATREAK
jgi:hypothetical protein